MGPRSLLPPALLAAYALAFAWSALGRGPLGGDDHPGQLYRLIRAAADPAPWAWSPGWWGGYPELMFYPPATALAGALLMLAGGLSPDAAYHALLWVAYLLPGAAALALLRRALGDFWLALPGALAVLALSAGCRSGVEEGMRWGLVAARLGWGLLPLVGLPLLRWAGREGPPPWLAALGLAAVAVTHPAHLPGGLVMLAAAVAVGPGGWRRRLGPGAAVAGLGLAVAGVWLLPLVAHLEMARPLAWGDASVGGLARRLIDYPVLAVLALAAAAGAALGGRALPAAERWLLFQVPGMALVVAADAVVLGPLGLAWLPADRVADALWLALALAAGVLPSVLARAAPRPRAWALGVAGCALLSLLGAGREEPGLSLWPRPAQWPTQAEILRGVRMEDLWRALGDAPPGRVLFIRSGVPLAFGREWWRWHSHVTALTPVRAGRDILGGTFTHPSPVAGLLYTGSLSAAPLTGLAEREDGRSLLGRPLERIDAGWFGAVARRLRVSTVVALDEDAGHVGFLDEAAGFRSWRRVGPFLVFISTEPRALPAGDGGGYRIDPPAGGGWVETGLAWSPLWRADGPAGPVPARRSDLGLLEVRAPPTPPGAVALRHAPGPAEWTGVAVTLLALAAVLALGARARVC